MEITNVKIKKVSKEGNEKLLAFASVTFDNEFVVNGVRVIDGEKGRFVAMPNRKVKDKFRDIAHPINTEFREKITEAVFDAYDNAEDEE